MSVYMKVNANSIRPGNILEHQGKLWVVAKIQHTQPGKGGAYIQVEMKELKAGTKLNERFRSSEDVEKVRLDQVEYQFLYRSDDMLTLMHLESYEQIDVQSALAGDAEVFLQDGMQVTVESYEGDIVHVLLPETVNLKIDETEAVVKGQTAASSNKPAVLENGVRVMVPPFIEAGDEIVVRTEDASYVERVKS